MSDEDALVSRARARVGAVLCKKYKLVGLLGVGGMASVYSAKHLRNANRVAVKILHPEISVDPTLRARFLREGYAANTVDHAGTVRVLDDDKAEDGSVFLVMELLEGETLDARWERCGRRLGAPEVVSIARSLLAVLHAAHAKGIVHRDIKPENVFVTRDGTLKVLDFGIARLREASPTRTRSGAIFGTPAFMPPEQALGRVREVDAQSDVWAVGASMYTLLSGRLVHEAETAEETMVFAATRQAASLASVAPDVPQRLVAVVDRALARERKDRWPSALAMLEALEAVQKEQMLASRVTPVPPDLEPTDVAAPPSMTLARPYGHSASTVAGVAAQSVAPKTSRPAIIAAVVLGAAVAGGGVLLLVGRPPPGAPAAAAVSIAPVVVAPAASSIAHVVVAAPPAASEATPVESLPPAPSLPPPRRVAPPRPSPSVAPAPAPAPTPAPPPPPPPARDPLAP